MLFTAAEREEIRLADAEIDAEMALSPDEEKHFKRADRYHRWYQQNKAKRAAYNRRYYAEHTEHCCELARKYYHNKKAAAKAATLKAVHTKSI